MNLLITGSQGFIGKNLQVNLSTLPNYDVFSFERSTPPSSLLALIKKTDVIIHLAGTNRSSNPKDFLKTTHLAKIICEYIEKTGHKIPIIYASSIHALETTAYGNSKRTSELIFEEFYRRTKNPIWIYRLPGVFGKWCKPNYNSVVATFCNNTVLSIPINVHDPDKVIELIYIDDLIQQIIISLQKEIKGFRFKKVRPVYSITLGQLAKTIQSFQETRASLISMRVGSGLTRSLYATYLSYLPKEKFSYLIPEHQDSRGKFIEMLKTKDSGQFSIFSAKPGITRGGHFHNTKSEKFLVIQGSANFRFRHLLNKEVFEIQTSDNKSEIVESIPGWIHDITNIGNDNLIVALWANEIFDKKKPDTFQREI